jgi:hypothetical protein
MVAIFGSWIMTPSLVGGGTGLDAAQERCDRRPEIAGERRGLALVVGGPPVEGTEVEIEQRTRCGVGVDIAPHIPTLAPRLEHRAEHDGRVRSAFEQGTATVKPAPDESPARRRLFLVRLAEGRESVPQAPGGGRVGIAVRQHLPRNHPPRLDPRQQEILLASEVVEHGPARDIAPGRDVVHGGRRIATLDEQLERRGEQALPRVPLLAFAAARL